MAWKLSSATWFLNGRGKQSPWKQYCQRFKKCSGNNSVESYLNLILLSDSLKSITCVAVNLSIPLHVLIQIEFYKVEKVINKTPVNQCDANNMYFLMHGRHNPARIFI